MPTETKKNLDVNPLPPECEGELKYLKQHADKITEWRATPDTPKESMEPLDASKIKTILHTAKADPSKSKILRIGDHTRFWAKVPMRLIPISNDLMISDTPDEKSIITVPVGKIVDVTEIISYIHTCVDLLTIKEMIGGDNNKA
ncbi:hypothetical protein AJ78_04442 [Emergomyces pasteurianus Ep9510]|uniref:Uncharacterized protein n=1 Tax=Emergomyces pasteurianus Ep9510 TaxID=1447872 RepID=A0A1J9QJA8_9EURO|nr:hypothetical protein AJ78_04442 [Emergomyces pasteurianus Ep9510]